MDHLMKEYQLLHSILPHLLLVELMLKGLPCMVLGPFTTEHPNMVLHNSTVVVHSHMEEVPHRLNTLVLHSTLNYQHLHSKHQIVR